MRHGLIGGLLFLLAMGAAAQQPEYTHRVDEVDRARAFTLIGWSPVGATLAYFRHADADYDADPNRPQRGTLHFYQRDMGENCAYPDAALDVAYGNGERRDKNLWLRDGRYLSIQDERAVIFTPCAEDEQDITAALPAASDEVSIVAYSPQRDMLLLRARHGLYLYSLEFNWAKPVVADDETFDFNLGKGAASPDGNWFAFTLSGPGDTYVIGVSSAQAKTVIDEPLPPGEDECCTTPRTPRWLNGEWIIASTHSLGGQYGDVLVNRSDGSLITAPDGYEIVDAYWESDSYQIVMARMSGGYGILSRYSPEPYLRENLDEVRWQTPGIWLEVLDDGTLGARSLLQDFGRGFTILLGRIYNVAAARTRLAAGNEQFVSVYDVESAEWIETLAPPGYHNFDVRAYKPDARLWSADERSLALTARQEQEAALLVATLDVFPIPTNTPSG